MGIPLVQLVSDYVESIQDSGALLKDQIPGGAVTLKPVEATSRPKPKKVARLMPTDEDVNMKELGKGESVEEAPVIRRKKGKGRSIQKPSPTDEVVEAKSKRDLQESFPRVVVPAKRTRLGKTPGLDSSGLVVEEGTPIEQHMLPVGTMERVSRFRGMP